MEPKSGDELQYGQKGKFLPFSAIFLPQIGLDKLIAGSKRFNKPHEDNSHFSWLVQIILMYTDKQQKDIELFCCADYDNYVYV